MVLWPHPAFRIMNETQMPQQTLGDALADQVEVRRGPQSPLVAAFHELGAVDRAVYEAVARTPTAQLDDPVRRLTNAANNSRLWLAIAAGMALVGGRTGRRAALEGVASIGVTSALVNLAVKPLTRRARPHRAELDRNRHVRMPASTSFPSGHAASAFAFANGVGRHLPVLAVPLRLAAGAVAYSRVHTGVHYPGDVVIGAIIGGGTAAMVTSAIERAWPPLSPQRSFVKIK
jgi:membrane-associated phospholipid phosphatase